MNTLREVQSDMAFHGWKGPADIGFTHKEDVHGVVIALAHDETWNADLDAALKRAEATALRINTERLIPWNAILQPVLKSTNDAINAT